MNNRRQIIIDYLNECSEAADLILTMLKFIDRMHFLGQAMPPNAISMEIQKALKEIDDFLSESNNDL